MDPTGEFTGVGQMLPKKKGQNPKDRARDIENTIDWMRSVGIKAAEDDVQRSLLPFQFLAALPKSDWMTLTIS